MSIIGNFFSGIKDKAMAKLLEKQLANIPPEQRDMVLHAVQKNPQLFEKIAKEIEAKKKAGMPEIYASMQVMKQYQAELQRAMMGNNKAA